MIDDNLTRAEARERARTVSNVSYDVHLDVTGEGTFRSETRVSFLAPLVGMATFLDLDARAVERITYNGRDLDPSTYDADRGRIPLRGLLASNEVTVVARCDYQRTGVGLHRMEDPTDGAVYLHTQFEPFDAHRVFACFDQPDLKAEVTVAVRAPADWEVVSNSPLAQRDGDLWRFAPTPPLPTYLVAVVAGPYVAVRSSHRGLDLGIYCRRSLQPHLDPDELFALTRQGLDFFTTEFGLPYPFDKYDQLFVPEFNFGAMENPGCVTFNEVMVFRSRVTEATREHRSEVLLHEMAHMWFGDLVTMRWWDDLWLNESFATYMATHAQASATRFTDAWVRFALGTKAHAVGQDQLPSTHPVSADIVDTDAVRLHFDGITYSKGASVLRQLVAWVGQEAFAKGVAAYFERHQWENAELGDFLDALAQASGRDLGGWPREWLGTAGVNTLRVRTTEAGGAVEAASVEQAADAIHPTLRSHRLAVGLYDLAGGVLGLRRRVELDVTGPSTPVLELAGEPAADLVVPNDGDLTYAKLRLDERSLETLEASLSALADPLTRVLCWGALADMVRDGELAARRLVATVLAHAPAEVDPAVLGQVLGRAARSVDAYGADANRLPARAALAAAARANLAGAEPAGDRQLVLVRHLLAVGDGPDHEAWARGLLDGTTTVDGLAVDTDLRWAVVAALAASGADGDGELVAAEVARDPTDIGRRRGEAARASRPTAGAKAEAWDRLAAGGLHLAEVRAVAGAFHQRGQEALSRPYLERYLASLAPWWAERPREEALDLASGLFPRHLVDPATVAAVADVEAGLPAPVARILAEGRDGLERSLRARATDAAEDPAAAGD